MRRLLRRLKSRLYAERALRRRRALGVSADAAEVLVLDLGAPSAEVTALPAGHRVGFVDPTELRERPERFASTPAEVDAALAAGDRCLVVWTGEEIAYRAWVVGDHNCIAALVPGYQLRGPALAIVSAWAAPAHRGRGLNAAALAWLAARAREEGRRDVVAAVARWNASSRRAFEKAGFRAATVADAGRGGGAGDRAGDRAGERAGECASAIRRATD